jgi:hypothetical protein
MMSSLPIEEHYVGFEVLTAVVIKSSVFVLHCPPVSYINQNFGKPMVLLHASFLLGLFFNPEDGGDMFLRISMDYVALYPRR